jgi:hypothetical protein
VKDVPFQYKEYEKSTDPLKKLKFDTYNVVYIVPKDIKSLSKEQLKIAAKSFVERNSFMVLSICDYDLLFKFNDLSTFDIFRLKNPISVDNTTGIHIRCDEFWRFFCNRYSLSPIKPDYQYYKKAIEYICENKVSQKFSVFTDNPKDSTYQLVKKFLSDIGANYSDGQDVHSPLTSYDKFQVLSSWINDFKELSECETIISTPSSFCISASFMGKRNKTIIQSKDFLVGNIKKWDLCRELVDSIEKPNQNYSVTQLI